MFVDAHGRGAGGRVQARDHERSSFTGLLRDAAVPDRVSLLLYLDPRLTRTFDPAKGEDGKPRSDVLSGLVLWVAPAGDGYDVGIYFNLEQRS